MPAGHDREAQPRQRGKTGARRRFVRAAANFRRGDSWFDYPVPFFGGGIIPRLENRLGVPILNLAKAGDEVRYMLGVEERTLLSRIPKERLSGRRTLGRAPVLRWR